MQIGLVCEKDLANFRILVGLSTLGYDCMYVIDGSTAVETVETAESDFAVVVVHNRSPHICCNLSTGYYDNRCHRLYYMDFGKNYHGEDVYSCHYASNCPVKHVA